MYPRADGLEIKQSYKGKSVRWLLGADAKTLKGLGVTLHERVRPAFDPDSQKLEKLVSGEYSVVTLSQEELDDRKPKVVTMRQARLALLSKGLLYNVDAVIASFPSPQKEAAQVEWEFASTVERNSDLVAMLSQSLSLTDEQMDALFQAASEL